MVRSEYSDSLHTGTVYPFANHKGQYDMGVSTCVLVTVTHQSGDTTPYEHCTRVHATSPAPAREAGLARYAP